MPSKMGKYSIKIMAMLWFSSLITLNGKERVILAIHLNFRENLKKNKKRDLHSEGDGSLHKCLLH